MLFTKILCEQWDFFNGLQNPWWDQSSFCIPPRIAKSQCPILGQNRAEILHWFSVTSRYCIFVLWSWNVINAFWELIIVALTVLWYVDRKDNLEPPGIFRCMEVGFPVFPQLYMFDNVWTTSPGAIHLWTWLRDTTWYHVILWCPLLLKMFCMHL